MIAHFPALRIPGGDDWHLGILLQDEARIVIIIIIVCTVAAVHFSSAGHQYKTIVVRINIVVTQVALLKLSVHEWHAVPCRVVGLRISNRFLRPAKLRCRPMHHLSLSHVFAKPYCDVTINLDSHIKKYLICFFQVDDFNVAPVQGRNQLSRF